MKKKTNQQPKPVGKKPEKPGSLKQVKSAKSVKPVKGIKKVALSVRDPAKDLEKTGNIKVTFHNETTHVHFHATPQIQLRSVEKRPWYKTKVFKKVEDTIFKAMLTYVASSPWHAELKELLKHLIR